MELWGLSTFSLMWECVALVVNTKFVGSILYNYN